LLANSRGIKENSRNSYNEKATDSMDKDSISCSSWCHDERHVLFVLRRGNNITTSQTRNQMIQVTANSRQLEQMLRKLAGDSEYKDEGDEDYEKKEEVNMQESISKSNCSRGRCCCKMLIRVLDKENKP
jgi:hypothetical protein